MKIALLADLHHHPQKEVIDAVRCIKPDIITIAGDFVNRSYVSFVREMTVIAPTFIGLGNHDVVYKSSVSVNIAKTKAILVDNRHIEYNGLLIGGLSTDRDLVWLKSFASNSRYKILICHHPEYYEKYIRDNNINLILSGHAHGGQVCLFGRGLFSPGQGVFPKYTSGVYENRLIVSRGIANTAAIPRIFNKQEVVCIELEK